jgi:hypothetical protein
MVVSVERVDRVGQLQTEVFVSVESPGLGNESDRQIPPEPPVASFVGLGQRRAGNRLAEPEMVERLGFGIQTRFDIAQTLSPSHLCKGHGRELLATAEVANAIVRVGTLRTAFQCLAVHLIEHLRENEAARVHEPTASRTARWSSNPSPSFHFSTC